VDNDGDGLTDCDDPDCTNDPSCGGTGCDGTPKCGDMLCCLSGGTCGNGCTCALSLISCVATETICNDGIDNDGDGKIDCVDPDCYGNADCETNCTDGIDNDHDGLIDCADPDCFKDTACCGKAEAVCDGTSGTWPTKPQCCSGLTCKAVIPLVYYTCQ
jgi:hypothetical protein